MCGRSGMITFETVTSCETAPRTHIAITKARNREGIRNGVSHRPAAFFGFSRFRVFVIKTVRPSAVVLTGPQRGRPPSQRSGGDLWQFGWSCASTRGNGDNRVRLGRGRVRRSKLEERRVVDQVCAFRILPGSNSCTPKPAECRKSSNSAPKNTRRGDASSRPVWTCIFCPPRRPKCRKIGPPPTVAKLFADKHLQDRFSAGKAFYANHPAGWRVSNNRKCWPRNTLTGLNKWRSTLDAPGCGQ
jgi:hypothetical protein